MVGAAVVELANTTVAVVLTASVDDPFLRPKNRPTPIPAARMITAVTMPGTRPGCLLGGLGAGAVGANSAGAAVEAWPGGGETGQRRRYDWGL